MKADLRFMVQVALLGSSLLVLSCQEIDDSDVLLLDPQYLAKQKILIGHNDSTVMPAFEELIVAADRAMELPMLSVTDKIRLAPSGDKHDYASYSRYWWPDSTKENGLPYLRRDGLTNPDSQNPESSDRPRLGALAQATQTLALAYCFTEEVKYAQKAAELIRVWFINEATKMNPNVNHAQCRPGHNLGSKSGILDGRLLTCALEASLLIARSSALSKDEMNQLREWATLYYTWLTTDSMALEEAASRNNHGSYYDVQALYFALYIGDTESAKSRAQSFVERRMNQQILTNGSMPEEVARTRPLFYSVYNLTAMCLFARLAEHVDVDIWTDEGSPSRLVHSLNLLLPYSDPNSSWPQTEAIKFDKMELYPIILMAQRRFPDLNYHRYSANLPEDTKLTHRSNLAIPLMR